MSPTFIECSLESFDYRGETVFNNPVNLSLCVKIYKSNFAWYPDNIGKPSITFDGCDCQWAYDSKEQRDLDFDRIAKNKFKEQNHE